MVRADVGLAIMKKRKRLLLSASVAVILMLGLFALANRHRALVRQPVLLVRCMSAKDIQTGRWSHMLATINYFWSAYRVRIGRYGIWHCFPIYRPGPTTDRTAGMTFDDDIEVVIEFEEEAQHQNGH